MAAEKKAEAAEMGDATVTQEMLDHLQSLVGTKLRINSIFNQYASKEAIRNFVNGIGDINPLYRNEEYAGKTSYGSITAPPNWVYSIFPTWVSLGLAGVHGFHSGSDCEFLKPIMYGDTITPECIFTGFDEKPSSFAGTMWILYYDSKFYNQRQEVVAKVKSWSIRVERKAARKTGKYSGIQLPHPWKEAELAKVEADVLAEKPRGAVVRYWEDVQEGDKLEPVTKGPFGLTDMVAYCVGASPIQILAHRSALDLYQKHPAWGFRDVTTMAKEPIYAVHYNKQAANATGLPFPYDIGTQRQCWLIHLLTNWMGDEGWLKRNFAEYRRFVYFSDVARFEGTVTKKYVDDNGEYCVDIETTAFNQRGENTAPGQSTVILPSKEKGTWPVKDRVKKA